MIPLAAQGGVDGRGDIHVIRMKDGDHEIGYAIAEALDIADVPLAMAIAREPGPVAGVIALDDDQIEMLDVHWLFADQIDGTFAATPPHCLNVERAPACLCPSLRLGRNRGGSPCQASLPTPETATSSLT